MDRNLVGENMEMSKVYEELSKSISTKYFKFDEVSCGLGLFSNVDVLLVTYHNILKSWIREY